MDHSNTTSTTMEQNYTEFDNETSVSLNQSSSASIRTVPMLPMTVLGVFFTVRVIWSILALVGNSLTIVAVVKFRSLHLSTNFLVASLAVADFIQGLLFPLIILQQLFINRPSFVPLCLVEKTFGIIAIRANFLNFLWIAIDRFCYIAFPLRYPLWVTDRKTFILIGLTWFYLVLDTCFVVYFASSIQVGGVCKISLIVSKPVYDRYLVPQIFTCLFVTICCYIAIGRIAYKQGLAIAALQQPFETLEVSIFHKQKKKAKVMFTILAIYIITNCPPYVLQVVIRNQISLLSVTMEQVTTLIYYTNAFINPIVYAWKSKDFNVVFKKLLGLKNVVSPSDLGNVTQEQT